MTPLAASYEDPTAAGQLAVAPVPRRALFLDRDGVVNVDHGYVHRPEDTDWVRGIFELVQAARARGYLAIVVTNQAGIARGYYDEETFLDYTAWVHARFRARGAPLLATFYCPHHPSAGIGPLLRACGCRKPQPGMLLAAGAAYGLDLAASCLVGDTESDVEAARAGGVANALRLGSGAADNATIRSLDEAESWLAGRP